MIFKLKNHDFRSFILWMCKDVCISEYIINTTLLLLVHTQEDRAYELELFKYITVM